MCNLCPREFLLPICPEHTYGSGKPPACCSPDDPVTYDLADLAMSLIKTLYLRGKVTRKTEP